MMDCPIGGDCFRDTCESRETCEQAANYKRKVAPPAVPDARCEQVKEVLAIVQRAFVEAEELAEHSIGRGTASYCRGYAGAIRDLVEKLAEAGYPTESQP